MPATRIGRGNFLHGIGNRAVRSAVNALTGPMRSTAYEQTVAAGAATGLNGPNRVRNSATLFAEPNLSVDVVGNATYEIYGQLNLALTAAQGIKLDFAAGTATIVTGTMGGVATFWTTGSNTNATAIGATNAIPFNVYPTALNTAIDGSTVNTWTLLTFRFTCQFAQSGNLQIEFGQSAAGASNTDILPGSFINANVLDYVVES